MIIKDLVVTVAIAIFGNVTIGMLVKLALNKIITLSSNKLKLAEETNNVSVQYVKEVMSLVKTFIAENAEFKNDINKLINKYELRDVKLAELLEQNLSGEDNGEEETN